MGVHITADESKVALFDSVSGMAFGPVFNDSDEAQGFLDWLKAKSETESTFAFGYDILYFIEDPRKYRLHELDEVVRIFREDNATNS